MQNTMPRHHELVPAWALPRQLKPGARSQATINDMPQLFSHSLADVPPSSKSPS